MTDYTKKALQDARHQEEGDEDAAARELTPIEKLSRFQILDTIFADFLDTNSYLDSTQSLARIMQTVEKRYPKYTHWNIDYLATTYTKFLHSGPQVSIKLNSNGFHYTLRQGIGEPVFRHNSDSFIPLQPETNMQHFPRLLTATAPTHGGIKLWYDWPKKRTDIMLEGLDRNPDLCITFEEGSPYIEDKYPFAQRPRIKQR